MNPWSGAGVHRFLWVVALLVLAVAACDSAEPEVEAPEAVETCEGLVDVGEQLVRAYVQVLERTDVGDLLAGTPNENLDELIRIGDELDMRATGLGCDATDLHAAVVAATEDLEPSTPNVEMLLDVLRNGIGDPEETLPQNPATTLPTATESTTTVSTTTP